jgi:integrase
MKLTLKTAAAAGLLPGATDVVHWDDDLAGFGLRVRKGGSRVWIYRYRIGRKQFVMTLGDARAVPLPVARANAADCQARVRLGRNPAAEKKAARIETNVVVGPLVDQYLDARAEKWRPNSSREVRRHLLNYARPLHGLPVSSLSLRVISDLLTTVKKKSGSVTSNRLRASLAAFLGWIIRTGIRLPDGNSAALAERFAEKSRSRVLSDAEIKAIWRHLDNSDHDTIVRLLLLTGQRAAEIGGLLWDEVQGNQIVLTGERTKNKRAHIVPLSEPAQALLNRLKIVGRNRVFGRDDSNGFRGWSIAKQRLDQRIAKTNGGPLADWVVHDLRRTVATKMAELGVQPHIIEAVLNHVSGYRAGVAGIYNRASYAPEKREALDRWARHVLEVVEA